MFIKIIFISIFLPSCTSLKKCSGNSLVVGIYWYYIIGRIKHSLNTIYFDSVLKKVCQS